MIISSRTPEGDPNRCAVCGTEFKIEPSEPTRDAPCPSCGQLLWWDKPVARVPSNQNLHEFTRRVKTFVDIVTAKMTFPADPAELMNVKVELSEVAPQLEAEFGFKFPEMMVHDEWSYGVILSYVSPYLQPTEKE